MSGQDRPGQEWLAATAASVAVDPAAVRTAFPAVGRRCGRGPLDPGDPQGLVAGTVDDAARAVLLDALPLRGEALAAELADLYRYGDAAERRGVLRALPRLSDRLGDAHGSVLPLLRDALRTNDVRLVAAALGPCASRLGDAEWRQAVLKCVFVGVPLAAVAGLDERADAELATMLVAFAHERVAAGRDVPADVWRVVDRHPAALAASGLPAELRSPVPERRAAAERALAGRPVPTAEEA